MSEDITPKHLRCPLADCPSVHLLDDERVLIVGETALGGDASMHLVQIAKILETVGRLESAVIVSPDLLSDLPELTRLRKENEILREILRQIDKVVAFESHGLGNGFAERVEEILGCQASGLQGGEAVSQALPALHPGAGGEAHWNPMSTAPKPQVKHWGDAPLILAATKFEHHDPVLVRWLHHDQIWLASMGAGLRDEDLIGWLPLPQIQRPDEEPLAAMSALSTGDASLTPIITHENPPRTAEDQSTAIAQPPEASSHQKPT